MRSKFTNFNTWLPFIWVIQISCLFIHLSHRSSSSMLLISLIHHTHSLLLCNLNLLLILLLLFQSLVIISFSLLYIFRISISKLSNRHRMILTWIVIFKCCICVSLKSCWLHYALTLMRYMLYSLWMSQACVSLMKASSTGFIRRIVVIEVWVLVPLLRSVHVFLSSLFYEISFSSLQAFLVKLVVSCFSTRFWSRLPNSFLVFKPIPDVLWVLILHSFLPLLSFWTS